MLLQKTQGYMQTTGLAQHTIIVRDPSPERVERRRFLVHRPGLFRVGNNVDESDATETYHLLKVDITRFTLSIARVKYIPFELYFRMCPRRQNDIVNNTGYHDK